MFHPEGLLPPDDATLPPIAKIETPEADSEKNLNLADTSPDVPQTEPTDLEDIETKDGLA